MPRIALPLLACTALLAAALPVLATGLIFEGITTTQQARRSEVARVRLSVQADKARLDFLEGGKASTPEGGYLFTTDAGQTITMVDNEAKRYAAVDLNQMGAMAGQVVKASGGLVGLDVTDQSVEMLVDERGPDMHGYPTRHRRFKTSYTMHVSILGIKRRSTVVNEEEAWVTAELTAGGFDMWRKRGQMQTGIESLDQLIQAEAAKTEGIPLKRIVSSTTTDSKGKSETTTTTTEVTSVKQSSLPDSLFSIPAGYTDTMAEAEQELTKAQRNAANARAADTNATHGVISGTLKSIPFVGRLFGSKPQP
jgi:hypothetical protein